MITKLGPCVERRQGRVQLSFSWAPGQASEMVPDLVLGEQQNLREIRREDSRSG